MEEEDEALLLEEELEQEEDWLRPALIATGVNLAFLGGGFFAKAEQEIGRLKMETEQLTRQLQVATATVETLSSEYYTRMFAADRTQQDIETSRKKILDTLKQSENHLTGSSENDEEYEDLVITLADER